MQAPLLTLSRGDSLNAWALSAVRKTYFPGKAAPASDPQNYKYINGFVDVGDLPCRVATWRDVATRTVQLETDWPVESLYLPGKSRAVEFSQFQHRPTRLSRWCRTRVSVAQDCYCSFKLTTRGGVHIWVDGELAARFEPFTRNSNQSTVVHLPLRAEGSDIVVLPLRSRCTCKGRMPEGQWRPLARSPARSGLALKFMARKTMCTWSLMTHHPCR
jgi:hypothetical protein